MAETNLIGQWTCPSGNSVDVIVQGEGLNLNFLWDQTPLSPEDHKYYLEVIRPQALRRLLAHGAN